MTRKTHLWIDDPIESDGTIIASATIENPKHERKHLWYRLSEEHSSVITKACDPFVLGTLFMAMLRSTDLYVHGEVSPSLLRNLEEFQSAWICWRPNRYTKIEICADVEKEQPKANNSDGAVVVFSGGLDSCFTVWRHYTGSCGRFRQNIQAGIMVHGFDIPLDQSDVFRRASAKSRRILESVGMELIPMATNFRGLEGDWDDTHGAGLASCLMLLQAGYAAGLIGSSQSYHGVVLPHGSNPMTDWLMSSDNFSIIHDGTAFTRGEKAREIANWPEALKYLRVCWQGKQKDRNCGRCEKCIRTILNFRSMGLSLPECFEEDVSDNQIMGMKDMNLPRIVLLEEILSTAKEASISESWVIALEKCVKKNRKMAEGRKDFWKKTREKFGILSRLSR